LKISIRLYNFLAILTLIAVTSNLYGQNGVRAFGIQYKPIFPLGIVNTDGQSVSDPTNNTKLDIITKRGSSIGAVIRIGLSKRWSLETGINYVKRNYDLKLSSPDFKDSEGSLQLIGYEIPVIAMIFVKLGENMYMNAASGISFDFFPTGGIVSYDRDTIEYGMLESNWLIPALNVNLGFEYRTKNSGYFYIGSSYHIPFSDIATVFVSYRNTGTNKFEALVNPPPTISGTYFTLDLRYFFNPGMKEKKDPNR